MKRFEKIRLDLKEVLARSIDGVLSPGKRLSLFVLVSGLLLSAMLHGTNMLHFPYYEGDEGTYMSQAWSVVKKGELAPYTYWYDHAPMGWYAIAGFVQLLGGDFFQFGSAIDTGRVFMLFVHLASVGLIFHIVHRMTGNAWIGAASIVLFSISSIELYFQRRVLLDNIMIFWVLAATAILLVKKEHIWNFVLAGLFLALGVLTKITAVLFFLPILFAVYFGRHRIAQSFRVVMFSAAFFLTYSVYLLYAFIKGELFPSEGSVSFISSFLFQMSRGGGGVPFWHEQSMFMQMMYDWILKDELYMTITAVVLGLSVALSPFRRELRLFTLGALLYVLFLIRGGVVLNFYVIPIFPFVAILGGLLLAVFSEVVRKHVSAAKGLIGILAIVTLLFIFENHGDRAAFVVDETSQQKKAVHWIKENLREDQVIIADNYALVDLWDPAYYNGKSFRNADWFYKVENDSEIRDVKYGGDWRNIDYLLVNHEMIRQIERKESPIMQDALTHASPVAKWLPMSALSYVDEQRFISTNGDWTMIYAINRDTQVMLSDAWIRYKGSFMQSYGQVIDPDTGFTTSEGQSYAMLMSAWMNDKDTFKGSWLWTKHHFQNRLDDRLFSWKWDGDTLSDSTNASDADQDIALALLFGYRMFGDEEYLDAAKEIIRDIWKQEVREINGRLYLLPMNHGSAMQPDGLLFNPSYLSPAWYRIFQEVDPEHDWSRLARDSYRILDVIADADSAMPLPYNWYVINEKTGSLSAATGPFGEYAREYSYDAFRTFWRIGMDWEWFESPESEEYLSRISEVVASLYDREGELPTSISSTGRPLSWEPSTAVDTGYLSTLRFSEKPGLEDEFYRKYFVETYDTEKHSWGSGNYYDSSWAWFGVGLHNRDLLNLWTIRLFQ